jgi:parallel beta-helix repeat protein
MTLLMNFLLPMLLFLTLVGEFFLPITEAGQCGGERPCQCGDQVTANYHMTTDLGPCPGRGLRVLSGITLDCHGYAVRGAGGQAGQVGIALSGATGATVRDCEVRDFSIGIRLRDAHNNRVQRNRIHDNGNFTTHRGYGIDVAGGSTGNLFEGNHIYDNADEGIHVGTGSHRNSFIGNTVYNNFRENLYILRSDKGVLKGNLIYGGGANSLFLKHASFHQVENNTFRDRTVLVRGDAHDNSFTGNNFINTGIHFQIYSEKQRLTRPTRNVVTGGKILNATKCLQFSGASDNVIRRTLLDQCEEAIVSAGFGMNVKNTLIDVALTSAAWSLDSRSLVDVGWSLEVTVSSAENITTAGAHVKGFDVNKKLVFDAVTGTDGSIPVQEVIAYTQDGASKIAHTPHTLEVTAGSKTTIQTITVNAPTTTRVTLPAAN